MKRFFAILFIICLLSGISVWEEILLHNTIYNIESQTTAILTLVDNSSTNINTEEIGMAVDNFKNIWKDEENKLCFFTNYEKIKSVNESISKLSVAVKNNEKSLAIENISNIQSYAHFLHYMMGFNINNLL